MSRKWITSEPTRFEKFQLREYAACFLDILDQRAAIRELNELPETPEERKVYDEHIRKSVHVKRVLNDVIRQSIEQHLNWDRVMPADPETIELVKQLHECKIGFESFADTAVLFSPIARDDGKPTSDGIFVILNTCARVMLGALGQGIALRGGISLGVGVQLDDREFYGPAALQAYDLEHNCAGYPRIVVDDAVADYLKQLADSDSHEQQDVYNRAIAMSCLPLLVDDEDGLRILDYLGTHFRRTMNPKGLDDDYRRGLRFVSETYQAMASKRDPKLAPRYAWLLRYYERNKAHWSQGGTGT